MCLMKRQNDIMNREYNDKRKDRMNLNNIIIWIDRRRRRQSNRLTFNPNAGIRAQNILWLNEIWFYFIDKKKSL